MKIQAIQNNTIFGGINSKPITTKVINTNINEIKNISKKNELHYNTYANTKAWLQCNMDNNVKFNAKNILKTLSNKDVKSTNGEILNGIFGYMHNTVDFLINDAKPKEKELIINELSKLNNINYNKVNKNGISILEKIIKAEDLQLLNLVKRTKLNYYQPLDMRYKMINNEKFKSEALKLKLNFYELKTAILDGNFDKVMLLESQFDSPFYKIDTQGKDLAFTLSLAKNEEFKNLFKNCYGNYVTV